VSVDRRSALLLLLLASLWGASYLFIKIGLRDGLRPADVVFLRTGLAALAMLPFALRRGAMQGLRPHLPFIAAIAAVDVAAPFLLISGGEQWISSGLTGVLVASMPIWTALLAPIFDRAEAPTRAALGGIVAGLVGVGLVLGVGLGGGGNALLGGLMVVAAGLGYSIGAFWVKRLRGVDTIAMVAVTMGLSALMTLPVAVASPPAHAPGPGAIAAMVALGVGGTGVAFIIFYGLIAHVGPARAALVTYLAPGFAVFYGVVLNGEPLTAGTIAGLVLIVGGSWLAGRGGRRAAEPVPARAAATP
jgi:drug/metabolite transporter (DMT)-like permease